MKGCALMKRKFIFSLIVFLSLTLFVSAEPKGSLFIIGGGKRPEKMMRRFIEMAEEHKSGKIIIFPMASNVPHEVGPEQAEQLKGYGAKEVEYHILSREQADLAENASLLDEVGGVFFSGGVQSRLMDVLRDTLVHKKLMEIYDHGAVIGGTSAGAAVMSEIMITGEEKREVEKGREFSSIEADNIVTVPGFGFVQEAIIDQHFVFRKRHNRLISLVIEHPELLGIGIDESTAVVVSPDQTFEVLGTGKVIVYDAQKSRIEINPEGSVSSHGMAMHVLRAGDRFSLLSRKVVE
jgi:cyanophycinase